MKKNFSLYILIAVSGLCLSSAIFIGFKSRFQTANLSPESISAYEKEMIAGYQKKQILVRRLLSEAQIKDPAIEGILFHIPNWKANSLQDVREIEELNAHLDTWLSSHLNKIQTRLLSQPELKKTWTELQELDRFLMQPRHRLLSKMSPKAGNRFRLDSQLN